MYRGVHPAGEDHRAQTGLSSPRKIELTRRCLAQVAAQLQGNLQGVDVRVEGKERGGHPVTLPDEMPSQEAPLSINRSSKNLPCRPNETGFRPVPQAENLERSSSTHVEDSGLTHRGRYLGQLSSTPSGVLDQLQRVVPEVLDME